MPVTPHRTRLLICLLLAAVVISVYGRAVRHEFIVEFDDAGYVVENPHVHAGLTPGFLTWAFGSTRMANWSPLTWVSHAIDYQAFGLNSAGHHAVSVLLHVVNTLLLFLVFANMTGATWRSALVAALFGLHPLHVESVAWVAERKDVLSTMFWMLTMAAYVRYARRGGIVPYSLTAVCLALGLMAKSMLVTLPCVLMLLDFWPLRRVSLARDTADVARTVQAAHAMPRVTIRRAVMEKVPLLALAAASSIVTVIAQRSGEAVHSLESFPFSSRIANAVVAYAEYLRFTVWPENLAVLYPYRQPLPTRTVVVSLLLLCSITGLALWRRRSQPYLLIGWLWFLGTLVPVIGLVQVGEQAMADRYTYVPLIGVFMAVAWWLGDLTRRFPGARPAIVTACFAAVAVLAVGAWRQVGVWRDPETLFRHALRVTRDNYMIHGSLGDHLMSRGRMAEALEHFDRAVQIRPNYLMALSNAGAAAASLGRLDVALARLDKAVALEPDNAEYRLNLSAVLAMSGRIDEAAAQAGESLRSKPDQPQGLMLLGQIRAAQGRLDEALAMYEAAVGQDPSLVEARIHAAETLIQLHRANEARQHLEQALRHSPDDQYARTLLDSINPPPPRR